MIDSTMTTIPHPHPSAFQKPSDPIPIPLSIQIPHGGETHRRGYQACDPCRKRKVKCDLGSEYILFIHTRKLANPIQASIIHVLLLVSDVVVKVRDVNSPLLDARGNNPVLVMITHQTMYFNETSV